MSLNSIPEKLVLLRQKMRSENVDVFIAMSADPHMSEYLAEFWKVRLWLTGFTGSVGTILVTADFAGLWVDGRYWVQAEQQLVNTGFELQKQTTNPDSTHLAWLTKNLKANAFISVNGQTISAQQFADLQNIAQLGNFNLSTELDLISQIWIDRPALPAQAIWQMPEGLNALTRAEKIQAIRSKITESNASAHFISALDDIAWLLNCRGKDVEYNPVFLAHLWIEAEHVFLFIDTAKVSEQLKDNLIADGVQILPYIESHAFLSAQQNQTVLIDPAKVSILHAQQIAKNNRLIEQINPSTLLKSRKHPSEIAHIRNAMQKDGVALCHFFHWLEHALASKQNISELTIDEKITAFRAEQSGFIGLSFSTIAGFNENGALPHYRATEEHYSQISGNGLLLIDSGGQYIDGTTDITRVVPLGQLTAQQRRDYTLVLKCHIALAQTTYPEGLQSPLLDAICRQSLWKYGLDYRHGTGHGVGFALNVHEGPQVLSYYAPVTEHTRLREGMIISNEPGLYHAGQYGIRIENLVVNQLKPLDDDSYGEFLEFETLTLCPIHLDPIDLALLDDSEKKWLNEYHQMVFEKLSPLLKGDVLAWLTHHTRAI